MNGDTATLLSTDLETVSSVVLSLNGRRVCDGALHGYLIQGNHLFNDVFDVECFQTPCPARNH